MSPTAMTTAASLEARRDGVTATGTIATGFAVFGTAAAATTTVGASLQRNCQRHQRKVSRTMPRLAQNAAMRSNSSLRLASTDWSRRVLTREVSRGRSGRGRCPRLPMPGGYVGSLGSRPSEIVLLVRERVRLSELCRRSNPKSLSASRSAYTSIFSTSSPASLPITMTERTRRAR